MHNTKSDVALMNNSRAKINMTDLVHSIQNISASPFLILGFALKFWSLFSLTFLGKGSYNKNECSENI